MEKVKIQFLARQYVCVHGVNPVEINPDLAKEYVGKGIAKYVNAPPKTNPVLETQFREEKKRDVKQTGMLEERFYTQVGWLGGLPPEIRKTGESCGFKSSVVTSQDFSIQTLLQSDFIVVSSFFLGYMPEQLRDIKVVLYQKEIPYVCVILNEPVDEDLTLQFLTRSSLNLFDSNSDDQYRDLLDVYKHFFGERIGEHVVVDDYYTFWRLIWEKLSPKLS